MSSNRKPTPLMIEALRTGADHDKGVIEPSHRDSTLQGLVDRGLADWADHFAVYGTPGGHLCVITEAGRAYLAELEPVVEEQPVEVPDGEYRMFVGMVREGAKDMGVYQAANVRAAVANRGGWPVARLEDGTVHVGYSYFVPVAEVVEERQEGAQEELPSVDEVVAAVLASERREEIVEAARESSRNDWDFGWKVAFRAFGMCLAEQVAMDWSAVRRALLVAVEAEACLPEGERLVVHRVEASVDAGEETMGRSEAASVVRGALQLGAKGRWESAQVIILSFGDWLWSVRPVGVA